MQQQGEMLQQLSKRIDNIIPKPTASAAFEYKSDVSSPSGDEQNQSPDRIQLHVGDDEKLDSDPEEQDMGKEKQSPREALFTGMPFLCFALD